jgi:hypothetical protein
MARRPRPRREATAEFEGKMKARLYEKYVKEVVPALKEKRKYTNIQDRKSVV